MINYRIMLQLCCSSHGPVSCVGESFPWFVFYCWKAFKFEFVWSFILRIEWFFSPGTFLKTTEVFNCFITFPTNLGHCGQQTQSSDLYITILQITHGQKVDNAKVVHQHFPKSFRVAVPACGDHTNVSVGKSFVPIILTPHERTVTCEVIN